MLVAIPLFMAGPTCDGQETSPTEARDERTQVSEEQKDKRPPQVVELADGLLQIPVPGEWNQVKPRSRIIQHEFSIPPVEQDEDSGRLTLSGGIIGGVKANIQRWRGQFTPPADTAPDEAAQISEEQIDDLTVHLVDLRGTFHDRRGPFAPAVDRPGYRMLAAIVETDGAGDIFIKFYGPEQTVTENAESFSEMIEGLQWSGR